MQKVLDVDSASWEREVLQAGSLVLVDFWHERCPWCKRLEPVYSEVAGEYEGKVRFARLNVLASHENQHVAVRYGVMSTPTLIFFCDGRLIGAAVGFQPKGRLRKLVDEAITTYGECLKQSTQLHAHR